MEYLERYSDNELSLRVYNDQYFYVERFNVEYLKALINEEFHYSEKQMEVLMDDLTNEIDEKISQLHDDIWDYDNDIEEKKDELRELETERYLKDEELNKFKELLDEYR